MNLLNKLSFTLVFTLALQLNAQSDIKANNISPISIGEQVKITSSLLHEERTLNIYLPLSYSPDSAKTYPVIYLLDGSMDEDFIHIAGLVQFGSFSWINMVPESIVVGISNVDRKRDFTYPTANKKDKQDFPTTGGSDNFIQFIEKELQPFIDSNYKTDSTKTIIGQSLGGLVATEILFKKPDLFDNYLIVSPSLWWDDESLLKMAQVDYSSSKSIYVAVGKEGKIMERVAKELFDQLNEDKKENSTIYYDFFEDQNHGDALHLAAYHGLSNIFQASKSDD